MRVLFLIFFSILCFSCSSKPKNSADHNSETSKNGFELYGNSDSGNAGGLRTVFFMKDSSVLNESSKKALQGNADFIKANPSVSVEIEGHCDERGSRQYNLSLGERRAKTTKEYLVALGVSAKQLTTLSFGNEKPLAEGHSESEWSKNRRANFSITAK